MAQAPTPDDQRKYMEALRELSKAKKAVPMNGLIARHGLSRAFGVAINELQWANPIKAVGSIWIGPKPKTEDELFRMATLVRAQIRDHKQKERSKAVVACKKPVAPRGQQYKPIELDDLDELVEQERREVSEGRESFTFSLLWGAVKVKWK